jgi:hypothetical protein
MDPTAAFNKQYERQIWRRSNDDIVRSKDENKIPIVSQS